MWHNATLLHIRNFENLETQYQQDIFDSFVNDEVNFFVKDLAEECKEKFHISTQFYQYGRMGATIAPDIFNSKTNGDFSNSPKIDSREEYDTDKEYINYLQNILSMFEYINQRVFAGIDELPEMWKKFIEANELIPEMEKNKDKHYCLSCGSLINN